MALPSEDISDHAVTLVVLKCGNIPASLVYLLGTMCTDYLCMYKHFMNLHTSCQEDLPIMHCKLLSGLEKSVFMNQYQNL